MAQMRHYLVTTNTAGVIGTSYLRSHSPRDSKTGFLNNAIITGRQPMPGREYALTNGATISYRKITEQQYAIGVANQKDARLSARVEEQEAQASQYPDPLHPPIRVRRMSCGGSDVSYTGVTDHDDAHIGAFGFGLFLDRADLVQLTSRAAEIGLRVEVENEEGSNSAEIRRAETEIEEQETQPAKPARRVINMRKVAQCGSISYTGVTLADDDITGELGFSTWLDSDAEYAELLTAADDAGIDVVLTDDENNKQDLASFIADNSPVVTSFGSGSDEPYIDEEFFSDEREVEIGSPVYYAAPPLSARQMRRKAGRLFGTVRRG